MKMVKLILVFLVLAILEQVKSYDAEGTLKCGDVIGPREFSDSDEDYWILEGEFAQDIVVHTCLTYDNDYTNTQIDLYAYSGTSGQDTINSGQMTYLASDDYISSYYDDVDNDDCGWYDAYIEILDEDRSSDNYVAMVSQNWGYYPDGDVYYFSFECPGVAIMAGSLACGEEALGTVWESDSEYWFLDVSTANEFTVSTCDTEDSFGVDTTLTLYAYEGSLSTSSSYTLTEDWSSDNYGRNNDDYYYYCVDEGDATDDSYLREEDAEYDTYIVVVEEVYGEGVGEGYNLKLTCDDIPGSSDALTTAGSTGVIVAAVLVPLAFFAAVFWVYRSKREEPVQMEHQEQMYQGGVMYGQQLSAPQQTHALA